MGNAGAMCLLCLSAIIACASGASAVTQSYIGREDGSGVLHRSISLKLMATERMEVFKIDRYNGWTAKVSALASSSTGAKLAATAWGGRIYTSANYGVTWVRVSW